jgi:hypothetical protein
MGNPTHCDRVAERRGDVLLTRNLIESLRSPLSRDDLIAHKDFPNSAVPTLGKQIGGLISGIGAFGFRPEAWGGVHRESTGGTLKVALPTRFSGVGNRVLL